MLFSDSLLDSQPQDIIGRFHDAAKMAAGSQIMSHPSPMMASTPEIRNSTAWFSPSAAKHMESFHRNVMLYPRRRVGSLLILSTAMVIADADVLPIGQ